MSRKLIPVKLTAAQWALVTEAVSEWAGLCEAESEYNDGTFHRGMLQRSKRFEACSTKIGLQVMAVLKRPNKRRY